MKKGRELPSDLAINRGLRVQTMVKDVLKDALVAHRQGKGVTLKDLVKVEGVRPGAPAPWAAAVMSRVVLFAEKHLDLLEADLSKAQRSEPGVRMLEKLRELRAARRQGGGVGVRITVLAEFFDVVERYLGKREEFREKQKMRLRARE